MKIAICENNKMMLDRVYGMVSQYQFGELTEIHKYSDGDLLKTAVARQVNDPYNIIFMDICLSDPCDGKECPDGIWCAESIMDTTPVTQVIYMSSYNSFYVALAHASSIEFLKKPVKKEALFSALDKCVNRMHRMGHRYYYYYKFKGKREKIDVNEVGYIYSEKRTINFVKKDEKKYYYDKLNEVEMELNKIGASFLRIHCSYLVNKLLIEKAYIDRVEVFGYTISVTDTYRDVYAKYLLEERSIL